MTLKMLFALSLLALWTACAASISAAVPSDGVGVLGVSLEPEAAAVPAFPVENPIYRETGQVSSKESRTLTGRKPVVFGLVLFLALAATVALSLMWKRSKRVAESAETDSQGGSESEQEEEDEYDSDASWWPDEKATVQWVNGRIAEAEGALKERLEKLERGDQMTLDLKEHVIEFRRLFEEMRKLSEEQRILRKKYFSLKARLARDSSLQGRFEAVRKELRTNESSANDALSRLRSASEKLEERENRWCKEHGELPVHESDPGFRDFRDSIANIIKFEEKETVRRRQLFERGEKVYISSERLNQRRIQKLEALKPKYELFLEAQREYFSKKEQAAAAPGREELQQAFQEARRRLYQAQEQVEAALKAHEDATTQLTNFEYDWSVAHRLRPPKNPYVEFRAAESDGTH